MDVSSLILRYILFVINLRGEHMDFIFLSLVTGTEVCLYISKLNKVTKQFVCCCALIKMNFQTEKER